MRAPVLALVALAAASAWAAGAGVLDIADKRALDAAITAHPTLAVLFRGPGCERCGALDAEWDAAAARLDGQGVALGRVDAAGRRGEFLAQIFEARSFPTIKVFRKGIKDRAVTYTGPTTAADIAAALPGLAAGPPPPECLRSREDVARFLAAGAPAGMIAYVPSEASPALAGFTAAAAAAAAEDVAAAYVTDRALAADAPCSGPDCDSPFIVMHKPGEGEGATARYEGAFEESLIERWAESRAAPLVARYSVADPSLNKAFGRAFKVKLPRLFGVFPSDNEIDAGVVAAFTAAAAANDDLKFFLTSRETGKRLVELSGVPDGAKPPIFAIVEDGGGGDGTAPRRFVKTGMRVQDLPEFIEEYKVGALEAAGSGEGKAAEGGRRDEL